MIGHLVYEPPGRSHYCDYPGKVRIGPVCRCGGCGAYYELRPVTGSQQGWYRLWWFPGLRVWLRRRHGGAR